MSKILSRYPISYDKNQFLVLENMLKNLSRYPVSYDNITLLHKTKPFIDTFGLEHLINKPTCFQKIPTYIDLNITNGKLYFKNIYVTVNGTSDFINLRQSA